MDTRQIVIRSFRGVQLALCAVHPDRGFAWTADRDAALKLHPADALKLARAAALHWGADCVTMDIAGVLTQPAEARAPRLVPAVRAHGDYIPSADTDAARMDNRSVAGEA